MTVAMKTQPSGLLTHAEHSTLLQLLGERCQSLATSVVQLFLTEPPNHTQWRRRDAGVLCFVKDHLRRSYFFRLFCLSRRNVVWEQQVYNDMEYESPRSWLHTFEAENAMAAFNFASEDEAATFRGVVLNQLAAKKQRRLERRSRASLGHNDMVQGSMPNLPSATAPTLNGPNYNKHHRSTSSGGAVKKKDKDAKRRIRKEDIGPPKDFRHVSHVGWDPNKGFDVDLDAIQDPNLKKFFEKAGVSETQLQDRGTREFIYEFIQRHGGLDAVKEDVVAPAAPARAPPVPSRAPPPPSPSVNQSSYKPSPPPPPPPSSTQSRVCPPTPVNQQRSAPPPPPPPSSQMTPSRPSAISHEQRNHAPAPPPPPPPPVAEQAAPATAAVAVAAAAAPAPAPDPRSELMAAIRGGASLKHVEVAKEKVVGDSRGELMDQIRRGIDLKSVQPNERPSGPSLPAEGLAGALARALAERNRAFHNDSDSESESESGDTDSEWEE